MTNESNQAALAKLIKEAKDNYSPIAAKEAAQYLAKAYKVVPGAERRDEATSSTFDEYVKAGFTELQALRLTVGNFN